MAVWEYKVISSGKGGFATPALLESFLNQLGKDEWEIVEFRTQPDNVLACTGLARRPTQRDWTLEDAAAAAARTEADKLRAEFEAKFKGAAGSATPAPEAVAPAADPAPDDGYRKVRDTERDLDPEAPDEEAAEDEWDKVGAEDELPTFFEALRPHLRRNQRGPGMSVGVDYLAKKWDLAEHDVLGALKECGLTLPEDEDAKPAYVEYDGDLFWVNMNRRGELWINTKEKPRPVFRTVAATPLAPEEEALASASGAPPLSGDNPGDAPAPAEAEHPAAGESAAPADSSSRADRPERGDRSDRGGRGGRGDRSRGEVFSPKARGEGPGTPLPAGAALLDRIRPMMRRNRREPPIRATGPNSSKSAITSGGLIRTRAAGCGSMRATRATEFPRTQLRSPARARAVQPARRRKSRAIRCRARPRHPPSRRPPCSNVPRRRSSRRRRTHFSLRPCPRSRSCTLRPPLTPAASSPACACSSSGRARADPPAASIGSPTVWADRPTT
jgi:hypothetical protein